MNFDIASPILSVTDWQRYREEGEAITQLFFDNGPDPEFRQMAVSKIDVGRPEREARSAN
jgi:hypothetical protein